MVGVIILEIIGLLAGFFISAELLADGTSRIEPLIGQGMAGGVLLGLMGSLPETIFVVIAVLHTSFDVAIGSAIGGNVIVFTLGMGSIIVIYLLKWKTKLVMKEDYKIELYFLGASTISMGALLLYGSLNFWSGLLLCLLYVVYLVHRYTHARHFIKRNMSTKQGKAILAKGLLFLAVGVALITLLSGPFVTAINTLSATLSIPAIWIALVISPIAADLDESISGYRLAVKSSGGGSTAIVSFLGSKLENNTVLLGLIGLLASSPVRLSGVVPELLIVIGVNIIAVRFILDGEFTFKEGVALIALYFIAIAAALVF